MSLDESRCKALAALLTEPSRKTAAKKAGISESTLRRYMNEPEFRLELARQTDHIIMDACTAAALSSVRVLSSLSYIAQNDREQTAQRISAAKCILDFTLKSATLLPAQRETEKNPVTALDLLDYSLFSIENNDVF